ncbi:MAG TPA: long-chain fatty acid--CoA ligase [Acetobacteraceae bacterium]|nr:long-chain fatty acid--CoA ligase [Acetobacteraceae bacterium]
MEAYPEHPNLAAMMFACARTWPDRTAFRAFRDGAWQATDWAEFARAAASLARGLAARGLRPGDRVVVVAENRPEVSIAETALMAIRAVPVPAYVTNTVEDHAHLLHDSGARAAIVSTPLLAARLREAGARARGLDLLVAMDAPRPGEVAYAALASDPAPPDDVAAMAAGISPETLACLIYTSGTGGAPRGVALPHRSLLANCRGSFALLRPLLRPGREVYLSFLPMSHAYEHLVGLFFLPSLGTEIVCARGVEHLAADMMAVRPTIMTVVPRVLEVIRARTLSQIARQPAWRRTLFEKALAVGLRRVEGRPGIADRLAGPLLDRLVAAEVRARFGGRFRAAMCGGARLEPEVGQFFRALGMHVMQGYGQSEAGPVISANPPGATRIETVGRPLAGVDLRIAEDGEILVRGDLVMDGYWRDPAATAAVLRDGWLHTGDIGALDADGYLSITDRKRDIIVLSGGENVSPARVEGMLMAEPEIAQAVVSGEGSSGLTALVVPAEGADEVAVAVAVTRANKRLAIAERVRRHRIVAPFTQENGLLTATQKIRRRLVLEREAAG